MLAKEPPRASYSIIQAPNACSREKLTAVNKHDNEADSSNEGNAKLTAKNLQQSSFEPNHSATRS